MSSRLVLLFLKGLVMTNSIFSPQEGVPETYSDHVQEKVTPSDRFQLDATGRVQLRSGRLFYISKLVIEGKELDIQTAIKRKPEVVNDLINKVLTSLDESTLENRDLKVIKAEVSENKYDRITAVKQDGVVEINLKDNIRNSFKALTSSAENLINHIFDSYSPKMIAFQKKSTGDEGLAEIESEDSPSEEPTEIIEKNETVQSTAQSKDREDGKVIVGKFTYGSKDYGHETIERPSVVTDDLANSKGQLAYLKGMLEKLDPDSEKTVKISKEITYYTNKLVKAEELQESTNWIHSNYFRDLLKSKGTLEEGIEAYAAIPVNMRKQEYIDENGEKKLSFYRLGVISDMSNGWTNLSDLKSLSKLPENERIERINNEIDKINERINGTPQKGIKKILSKYYKKPLKGRGLEGAKLAIAQLENCKNLGFLEGVIEQRRLRLRDQFLQVIQNQVKSSDQEDLFSEELPETSIEEAGANNFHVNSLELVAESPKRLHVAHLGLLNPNKSVTDSSGWQHDEYHELMDMREIFNEFNEKKIQFDADSGPYIDDDNTIHLPPIEGFPGSILLNTHFFNISVQSRKLEHDKQNVSLIEPLFKLQMSGGRSRDVDPSSLDDIVNRINHGESNHELAEALAFYLIKLGVKVSVGCLSAKDRTKVVAENMVVKEIESSHPSHEGKEAARKFRDNVWRDNHNASSMVLEENTGIRTAKYSPLNISPEVSNITKSIFAFLSFRDHVIKPRFGLGNNND